jgi:periplasmic protein CpxP/Spy
MKTTSFWRLATALCCVWILATGSLLAQGPGRGGFDRMTPEDLAARQTKRMTRLLKLDATQQKSVEIVHLKYAKKLDSMRVVAQRDARRREMRDQLKAMNDARENELKATMTAEQWKTWEENREKMRERQGRGDN